MTDENAEEDLKDICSHIVRNDFNEIGTLAHHKLLDRKIFIEEDFWVILKVWSLVKEDVFERRNKHSFNYMKHLQDLRDEACKYAEKKYPNVHKEFCHDNLTTGKK